MGLQVAAWLGAFVGLRDYLLWPCCAPEPGSAFYFSCMLQRSSSFWATL